MVKDSHCFLDESLSSYLKKKHEGGNIDSTHFLQKYGEIDVIVSNAAANPSVNAILDTQESVLDKLWEINVKASILLLKVSSFMNNVFTPKKTQKRKNKQKKGPFREHDAISEA